MALHSRPLITKSTAHSMYTVVVLEDYLTRLLCNYLLQCLGLGK